MVNGSIQKNGSEGDNNANYVSSSECIAWLTVLITESVAILTLNILTIIVFVRNRSLRKRSMYLMINLAVADMLVGGFTEVVYLVQIDNIMCNVWNLTSQRIWHKDMSSMQQLFPAASLTSLTAISLERVHATFRPFKHRVVKNWVLGVVITVTWVTAGLYSTVLGLIWGNSLRSFYIWCSFNLICLFIVFLSYTCIIIKFYCGAHSYHHGVASREKKMTKTLFIVTLVSLTLWLPFLVTTFLYFKTDVIAYLQESIIRHMNNSLNGLCFANSLVNPILYTIRMPEFRRALVSLIRRRRRQVQAQISLRATPQVTSSINTTMEEV